MAKSVNKVILIGNLGKDPEVKYTPSGTAVAKFSLATNERYKDKSGEWQDRTEWHNLVAYQRTAEIVRDYTEKGSKIYVEGALQTRKWTDQSGVEKYSTEVVLQGFNSVLTMLDGRSGGGGGGFGDDAGGDFGSSSPSSAPPRRVAAAAGGGRGNSDMDDDIPF